MSKEMDCQKDETERLCVILYKEKLLLFLGNSFRAAKRILQELYPEK